jgi:sugar phosphate isomerase/epimerase
LGLPIGLQLYTVRDQMQKDFSGTLAQVAAIGYQEVELPSFFHRKPPDVKAAVEAVGLKAPSGHCSAEDLKGDVDPLIASFREAGLQYMICAFPAHRPGTPSPQGAAASPDRNFSEDDYKWMADVFDKTGEKCHQAGIQFGYHNHNLDFKTFGGEMAFDLLMRLTSPQRVKIELDCYWVARAGKDPVGIMQRYAGRIPLLHIKDMKPGLAPTTSLSQGSDGFAEVGRGSIDWKRVFKAAPEAGVKHYFVEQDKCPGPPLESARISFEYLKNLQV